MLAEEQEEFGEEQFTDGERAMAESSHTDRNCDASGSQESQMDRGSHRRNVIRVHFGTEKDGHRFHGK